MKHPHKEETEEELDDIPDGSGDSEQQQSTMMKKDRHSKKLKKSCLKKPLIGQKAGKQEEENDEQSANEEADDMPDERQMEEDEQITDQEDNSYLPPTPETMLKGLRKNIELKAHQREGLLRTIAMEKRKKSEVAYWRMTWAQEDHYNDISDS
uniref:Uncharacterized protein n=1 Tax=Ditylenchus dipsaci TaxID=166011 RepID=A0A915E5D3_9BILA